MAHFYELPLLKERHSRVLKAPYDVGPADGGEDDVETHYPIYLDDARALACFEAARQHQKIPFNMVRARCAVC